MPSWLAHRQFEHEVSGILRYDNALLVSQFQTLLNAAGVHYIFWRKYGLRAKELGSIKCCIAVVLCVVR